MSEPHVRIPVDGLRGWGGSRAAHGQREGVQPRAPGTGLGPDTLARAAPPCRALPATGLAAT